MGGTQSSDSRDTKPPVPATPQNATHQIPLKQSNGTPINIPKSSIPGYSGAHRDAMEVIMSPPASPNNRVLATSPPSTDLIPTVFTWSGGGKSVYITGSFNDWKEKLPLTMSDKDFTLIQNLPPASISPAHYVNSVAGIHQYKFVVDGKWVHAQDQPTSTDSKGNVNNFVDVKPVGKVEGFFPQPIQDTGGSTPSRSPPGTYSVVIPDDTSMMYTSTNSPTQRSSNRAPIVPGLPPHLQRALLNTAPPSDEDPSLLPLPHHVMLNHLYILPKEGDDVTILGVTHRYRTKFVTTVLYKPFVGLKAGTADDFTVEIEL